MNKYISLFLIGPIAVAFACFIPVGFLIELSMAFYVLTNPQFWIGIFGLVSFFSIIIIWQRFADFCIKQFNIDENVYYLLFFIVFILGIFVWAFDWSMILTYSSGFFHSNKF